LPSAKLVPCRGMLHFFRRLETGHPIERVCGKWIGCAVAGHTWAAKRRQRTYIGRSTPSTQLGT
jgi:hypothetical protein